VLADNAGKAHMNFIHDHAVDMCFNMLNLNVNAVLFLARYYLAKFQKRFEEQGKRSAVINVSSIAALSPGVKTTVYGATKAFDRIFSIGMQKEYGDHIDVLTVLPMSTKTQMNSGRYLGTVTAAQHGKAVIDTLGWRQKETFGHWYQGLWHNLTRFWPTQYVINRINGKRREQFFREE
jgi:short-subunit dehydrogenase